MITFYFHCTITFVYWFSSGCIDTKTVILFHRIPLMLLKLVALLLTLALRSLGGIEVIALRNARNLPTYSQRQQNRKLYSLACTWLLYDVRTTTYFRWACGMCTILLFGCAFGIIVHWWMTVFPVLDITREEGPWSITFQKTLEEIRKSCAVQ